ncbi:MAG: anthranilate synthase component II [Parachlamydiaceae bacterium]
MLLLIDNFDSFTYNLVQQFQIFGESVKVIRNNALSIDECISLNPSRVVIGPGPGKPSESGISKELVLICLRKKWPLLGVCLGHQCLAEVFGGIVRKAKRPMHGMISQVHHHHPPIFKGIASPFPVVRYHSLVVEASSLPANLTPIAYSEDGEIMALKHCEYAIYGLQFHPESISTTDGPQILSNFLKE